MKPVRTFVLMGIAILAAVLLWIGWVGQVSNRRNDRNVARDRTDQVARYSNCLVKNDGRARVRLFSSDSLRIIFTARPLNENEQRLVDRLSADVKARGLQIYPDDNCRPLRPAHLTKAEKESLFKSDPIPPLQLHVTTTVP